LESNVPVSYGCRPPHIHVRVRAPSHEELVTQQYLLQRLGIVERLGGGHLSV
jgi:protocatechuate 3,4-dioxygenase beta subunit